MRNHAMLLGLALIVGGCDDGSNGPTKTAQDPLAPFVGAWTYSSGTRVRTSCADPPLEKMTEDVTNEPFHISMAIGVSSTGMQMEELRLNDGLDPQIWIPNTGSVLWIVSGDSAHPEPGQRDCGGTLCATPSGTIRIAGDGLSVDALIIAVDTTRSGVTCSSQTKGTLRRQ